eukprot:gnl/TRDRNA2_/TRDRNA2_43684_c0_seq1.p2 gnl/TRDRNA2_/TRDRNA2_43684_c0~~gnl/TRDRNA2_/TRDRNA2_43684_c0_seq1.p2  ORF type:complete len:162 (-),score=24.76 gnl/TRDRNA2_/TRDRNA2_43684_c0_seq1:105-590(-)
MGQRCCTDSNVLEVRLCTQEPSPQPCLPGLVRDASKLPPVPVRPVTITFQALGGAMIERDFTKKPLGVDFDASSAPMIVRRVHALSMADELGIRPGWTLMEVDGEPVSNLDCRSQCQRLQDAARRLPTLPPSVPLGRCRDIDAPVPPNIAAAPKELVAMVK